MFNFKKPVIDVPTLKLGSIKLVRIEGDRSVYGLLYVFNLSLHFKFLLMKGYCKTEKINLG